MSTDSTRRSAVAAIANLTGGSPAAAELQDLSDYRKVGVKGPGAVEWLRAQGVVCPGNTYDTIRTAAGSIVARVGSDEVIIESPPGDDGAERIDAALAIRAPGVFGVEQQTSTFRLGGAGAPDVWRQTCGVDVTGESADRLIYTRVAGVACGVLPEEIEGHRSYRLWVDYGYAPALFRSLVEIAAG
tara:strand:+ start:314 stop:871 length:558 start_codon:yes stop_codon:yes gene_type:complete